MRNAPTPRCLSPTPAQYDLTLGSGRCKTILEHRAAPGREALAPSCRPPAVARLAPGHDHPLATPVRRRVMVRAPCRQRRTTTGPVGTQGRRVMSDPPSRRRAQWGMTVRAPPHRRRVMSDPSPRRPVQRGMTVRAPPHRRRAMTYPSPPRRGRRVTAVRAPRSWCRTTIGPTTRLWRRRVTHRRAPARMCLSPPLRCRPA